MLQKRDFVQTANLSFEKETTVKFAENLELTCSPSNDGRWFNITNVKGDLEITKITINFNDGSKWDNKYDKTKNGFESYKKWHTTASWYSTCNATFYITANTEMKEMRAASYYLQVPLDRLQCLEPFHFLKEEFVLPGYDELKFTYCVKKIKESSSNDIEIHIVNPYDVKINGTKGDLKFVQHSTSSVGKHLLFGFYPSILEKYPPSSSLAFDQTPAMNQSGETNERELSEQVQDPLYESRPGSIISTELFSNTNAVKLLHKISTNQQFSDVFFIASDGAKIPSHRCILAEFSNIFTKIFEEISEIPVNIDAEDFNADTIQSALNFIYQKCDLANGKERDVFKFAVKYGIQELIDACRSFFEESVDPTNVCQYIQIAYSNNFADLKQKCLKLLIEKRKEIDSDKITDLPKNILVDAFAF